MGKLASRAVRRALMLCAMASIMSSLGSVASARHHHHREAAPTSAVAGQFDYYLLSLSWSPSYCITHTEDTAQCTKGFGFVLHGLWPQNLGGGYPQSCATGAQLTPEAQALGRTLFPSPKLIEHEWERHGTCSGMDAVSFFEAADRAMSVVHVPSAFEAPRANLAMTEEQVIAAFRAANPALPENGLTVACSRDELSEVRVCLSKALAPMACGRGVRSNCPNVVLQIPAAR